MNGLNQELINYGLLSPNQPSPFEALQQEADEAIYARRKFAVEQERTIKETELNTEVAVEEKQKQIAQKKMEDLNARSIDQAAGRSRRQSAAPGRLYARPRSGIARYVLPASAKRIHRSIRRR